MAEAFLRRLLAFLRVPPEPHLPLGEPGSARVFRAGAHFWTLKLLAWSFRQAATLAGFVFLMTMLHMTPDSIPLKGKKKGATAPIPRLSLAGPLAVVRSLEMLAWGVWLVQLPITLAVLRLDYALRWYIVTDRAARVREGILNLREMTFTLANVQDIRTRQGPLQRLLGLSDVELRTAGGAEDTAGPGGHARPSHNLHLAVFRGVDNAEEIRDLVADRMRKARGAGLGDPDDVPTARERPLGTELEAAARELAKESAGLRAAVSRRVGA